MPPSQSASLFLRWLLCKRPLIRGQHPLPEHQSVHKEQHTEERSRQSLRAEQRDAVHIPAAEQAAQDAQIQRVQQQKRDCDVIQDRAQQFTPGAAEKIGGFMESVTAANTPEPPGPPEESRCKVIPFERVG